MNDGAILAFMESIDKRLQELGTKVDALTTAAVTKQDCQHCKEQWIPKRYLLAVGAVFTVVSLIMGVVGDAIGVVGKLAAVVK